VIGRGQSYPPGSKIGRHGTNFSLYSRNASKVELLLFDHEDDPIPARTIHLDAAENRSYHYWHIFVPGIKAGQLYGYRVHGPSDPANGQRFDASRILLDPYARAVAVPSGYSRAPDAPTMKSVTIDSQDYDWEGDRPLQRPASQTVIYEMHVRGFTRHPNSGVAENLRGTYRGVIEKIPYLQQLGITAVELLPVFQFDSHDAPPGLVNYWGYAPVSFFAPHRAYSSCQGAAAGPVHEFRDMVKALHHAGIEVILDVVFNHTAEGDHRGPTFSFRGIDNSTYYMLDPSDRSRYADYSGTGNTMNANHPVVRRMIVDSLRYWVQEMHVDGFRFDLASILDRDASGQPMMNPPVLLDIESDPALAGTKLIAEAWDAAGLYQVGTFAGDSWREWNGQFRDDVRSFFRGDNGSVARIADRLLGSPQIYGRKDREPEVSVNFITCHDGFTLNDLVSYNVKHNEENEESNRDGTDDNRSWNYGAEGPTGDVAVEALRERQIRNLLACTMISLGMPMITMGDEVRRTQGGNNNAYCQDNETSWFDWSLVSKQADLLRFVRLLIQRRLARDMAEEPGVESLAQLLRESNKSWHGVKLNQPDWSHSSHSIALTAEILKGRLFIHWILNAWREPLDFELPTECGQWNRWIDTSLEPPEDIVTWKDVRPVLSPSYLAAPYSVVVLFSSPSSLSVDAS
jgi:isoamylase